MFVARRQTKWQTRRCKEFQPVEIDEQRCQALVWNHGLGKLQCSRRPLRGRDLCRNHENAPHGRVRGPMPEKKLDQFRKAALQPVKESKQWYSRHLMWAYASEMVPGLEALNELDERGQYRLNDEMYERCLRRIQMNLEMNKRQERGKYEQGAGVRTRADREGGGRYGSERERYNGVGGGKVFKWYSRAVFNNHLACMGASEQSCTER